MMYGGQRRIELGRYGEDKAISFLKKNGYKILERNYRSRFGEIDIIAEEAGSIVFVEVKSLLSLFFGPPYLSITKKKREHIVKSALSYLKRHGLTDRYCRIDVVSIRHYDEKDSVELIKDAFGMEGWPCYALDA